MSVHKQRFHLSGVSIAVLTALSFNAFGQENTAPDNDENTSEDVVEIIEVKGLKGSLKKSINDKRFSSGIRDTINAEDIGKSTDQNIADALGRVTGVTVVNSDGEGTQITVRGADANQNSITLNGQTLTSTDFSQAVDLSSFSADILSKLEVVKTPSADHDEGSLGASVNLVTIRPLNQAEGVRSLTLQGRYNDFSDKKNYKLQGAFSEKFLDDTLGVALTVYDETNAYRKDQYNAGDFVESQEYAQAVDQNGNVISGVKAIEPSLASYELHQNESNRYGGSLGIQWLPDDVSELMFDATYSKQELVRTYDAIQTKSFANNPNWIEGEIPTSFVRPPNPFSDPIDWIQVDTETYDMTKRVNRYGNGSMVRADGGTENENLSATLNYKRELTDTLRLEAQIGHSASKSESLPNAYTVMQNFYQVPGMLLWDAGADIEPVGVDCTGGGDTCRMVYGNSFIDLGEHLYAYTDETGARVQGSADNVAYTGFNPQDVSSFHLGFIGENDTRVEDKISNAQLDFDWDIDTFGVTTLEFGAKVTSRNKMVDNQAYSFQSLQATEIITDPVTGETVVELGGSLTDIRGDLIAGDPIPYDDFMESLGYAREGATVGWTPIDVKAAKEMVLGDGDVIRNVDNTASRETDIDTKAFYLKANFDLLDGRLTGDIGVRYVETDVEALGYSGMRYFEQGGSDLQREIDRHTLNQLADRSLAECPTLQLGEDGVAQDYELKYQRVDGLGWDTSAGPDPSTWVPIPDAGPCHDPAFADYADALNAFRAGEGAMPTLNDYGLLWQSMWRYADVATSRTYGWDALPVWNGSTNGVNTNYSWGSVENREVASSPAFKTHSYENILPSLNLNYAFSDEFVGRLAVSKTMTRPEIDLLRPGYKVTEGSYWGSGNLNVGRVDMYNTQLEPLESNNLDVSIEWYFNETSMLSVAYFRKDMSNFTDRETTLSHINSVRDPASAPESGDDLILLDDGSADALANCHPIRATTEFAYLASDPTTFSGNPSDSCANMTVTKTVNAKDAKIEGLEIGYIQTYDFIPELLDLPEWTGGFGVSANYTYQQSEYESEYSSINPNLLLPSYPVADTPEHSYNFTAFWEQKGHQIRLSFQGTSDSLVGKDWATGQYGRSWNQGSIWNEGRNSLDLSASYQVNEDIMLTFQAINLTDEPFRTYFTSRTLNVVRQAADNAAGYDFVALEEGNPLDGDAPKHRTYTKYKVGSTYRLGLRVRF
ncbi:TonB-dependent receptor [Aestuariibacter sp. A3R04]|uniref:TonB-dependent receptor n=1 Tax=Aestuariibacter sp. A3R04 TaxID=2841571 RepID=UPI001C09CD9A|nr:TonB-dependent receptor [Aestuariibacter sp. A3R04]MBU3021266.1 TonB-dependent receptor [Aestuariibacter sp. A3R04]